MSKLYVGNLPESTKGKDLRDLFESFGTVDEVAILRGYGFVHFLKSEDANAALTALDDSEFMGSHIQVQMARTKGHGYGQESGPPREKEIRQGPPEGYRDPRYRYEEPYSRPPPVREPPPPSERYGRYDYEMRGRYSDYDRYDYNYGRYPEYNGRSRSPHREYYPPSPRERSYYERELYQEPYREPYREPYPPEPYPEPYRESYSRSVPREYMGREYAPSPRRW